MAAEEHVKALKTADATIELLKSQMEAAYKDGAEREAQEQQVAGLLAKVDELEGRLRDQVRLCQRVTPTLHAPEFFRLRLALALVSFGTDATANKQHTKAEAPSLLPSLFYQPLA